MAFKHTKHFELLWLSCHEEYGCVGGWHWRRAYGEREERTCCECCWIVPWTLWIFIHSRAVHRYDVVFRATVQLKTLRPPVVDEMMHEMCNASNDGASWFGTAADVVSLHLHCYIPRFINSYHNNSPQYVSIFPSYALEFYRHSNN